MTVHAIYENGIFRPTETVDLPEKAQVVFEPRVVAAESAPSPAMAKVYEVLSRRFRSGEHNVAERHNEYQRCNQR